MHGEAHLCAASHPPPRLFCWNAGPPPSVSNTSSKAGGAQQPGPPPVPAATASACSLTAARPAQPDDGCFSARLPHGSSGSSGEPPAEEPAAGALPRARRLPAVAEAGGDAASDGVAPPGSPAAPEEAAAPEPVCVQPRGARAAPPPASGGASSGSDRTADLSLDPQARSLD